MASSSNTGFPSASGSGSGSGSNPNNNNNDQIWDVDYDCWCTSDGVLFADPIRVAPPQRAAEQQQIPDQYGIRRQRNLRTSRVLETRFFSFKLFRYVQSTEYLLEITEARKEDKTYYLLTPYERDGKSRMEAMEINLGNKQISPVNGEIFNNIGTKTNLTMEQRLAGRWTIEIRERIESKKVERFYSHERVNKTFRSMHDVATFIIYNITD